jgi:hypothetical protein
VKCYASNLLDDSHAKNINIISPTTYQFIKYGEIPVNEYSGSSNIEIPLFSIDTRGYNLPVTLRYNSNGIRVTEEADWVGLGWDLSFGSVVQVVNDEDDLSSIFTKKCQPFFNSTWPATWDYKSSSAPPISNMYINNSMTDYSNDNTYSFLTIRKYFGGSTYAGSPWGPNGWDIDSYIDFYHTIPMSEGGATPAKTIDYEKDIFIVNTPYEKLYIIIKTTESGTSYKVLNKKGYNVCINGNGGWTIINPAGVTYYFDKIDYCQSLTESGTPPWSYIFGDQNTLLNQNTSIINFYTSGLPGPTSRIWQITKIIDMYGDDITFNYGNKQTLTSTNISSQWKIGTGYTRGYSLNYDPNGVLVKDPYCETVDGAYSGCPGYLTNGQINSVVVTKATQTQERSYLSSIQYKGNTINFNTLGRDDFTNSQKLAGITITNSSQKIVNSIALTYNYYESNYSGRGFKSKGNYIGTKEYRLRLDNVTNHFNEKYSFTYNSEPLPTRNTFAIDYWGFYNGQLNNRSYLSNVADFEPNNSYVTTYSSIFSLNNPTIKYSKLNYCKAGVLEKIQYPTGGVSKFYYSLNSFDNYFVPSDPTLQTTQSYGNGLKVDSIVNYLDENTVSTKKYYLYESGKLQIPVKTFYEKGEYYSEVLNQGGYYPIQTHYAALLNIFSNSFYVPNLTGNGTGVGYSKVSKWEINTKNRIAENGKVVHYYINNPDIMSPLSYGDLIDILPTYHKGIENGSLEKELVYDNSNNKKKSTTYDYIIPNQTTIEYNSRVRYLGKWGINCGYWQIMIGYYPLYKPETLLSNKRTVNYFNTDSVVSNESYFYNDYNLIRYKGETTSNTSQDKEENYYYPFDITNNSQYSQEQQNVMQNLVANNRLSETIKSEHSIRTNGTLTPKTTYTEYDTNSKLPSAVKMSLGNNSLVTEVTFKYDSYKNVIEKTDKTGQITSYIWSYNNQYPVAKIVNATYSNVSNANPGLISYITSSANPSDAMLNSLSSSLRVGLPNAFVTTYTYNPLVGITSMTNARGVTTYYGYDTLFRLNEIYNMDSNGAKKIIQQNDYNFKH